MSLHSEAFTLWGESCISGPLMKVSIETLSPVKKKLNISVAEDEVMEEIELAYRTAARQAQIPGFRPGKAPRHILEKKFGASIEGEVYENLVRKTFVKALQDHSLDAVAMPSIEQPKREKGQGFSYVASIEVKPSFEPKDYTGLKLKKEDGTVTEEKIKEVYARLQDAQSVLRVREGATHPLKGDFVSVTIQGINSDGNLKSTDEPREQLYEIGGEVIHPSIEKALKSLKVDESAPVTIESKDKKEIHVRVTLKAMKEKILPSLDDEFAKSVGPFENMAALRERVTKDLQEELDERNRAELARKLLDEVAKKNPIDLPDTLVHDELHQLMHGIWQQFERAGVKEIPEEYSEKVLHEKLEPDAKRRVHEQLLIEAIAKKEKLEVKEEEVIKKLTQMASEAKVPVSEYKAYMEKSGRLDGLRFQLVAQKTVDFLLSSANIK